MTAGYGRKGTSLANNVILVILLYVLFNPICTESVQNHQQLLTANPINVKQLVHKIDMKWTTLHSFAEGKPPCRRENKIIPSLPRQASAISISKGKTHPLLHHLLFSTSTSCLISCLTINRLINLVIAVSQRTILYESMSRGFL